MNNTTMATTIISILSSIVLIAVIYHYETRQDYHIDDIDEQASAYTYGLPLEIVSEIYSKASSPSERTLMLEGASIAYNNQHLMGTALNTTDKLYVEVCEILKQKGVSIQFHPQYGMQIVKTKKY